jgi:hypothetical protein
MIKESLCSFCKKKFEWDTNINTIRTFCSHKCSTNFNIITEEKREILYRKRYEENVIRNENGCWGWKGHLMKKGYIEIRVAGKRKLGHRLAWEMHYGKVSKGKYILHHCDTPVCSKISHLYEGTLKNNARDCINRGRFKYPIYKPEPIPKEKSKIYMKSECIKCNKSFFFDRHSAVGRYCSKNCYFKRNKD